MKKTPEEIREARNAASRRYYAKKRAAKAAQNPAAKRGRPKKAVNGRGRPKKNPDKSVVLVKWEKTLGKLERKLARRLAVLEKAKAAVTDTKAQIGLAKTAIREEKAAIKRLKRQA